MKDSFVCPLKDSLVLSPCTVSTCMYFKRNESNLCGHSRISSMLANASTKEERKVAMSKAYRVSEEEFTTSLHRVVSVICLNEYFKYTYSKDLLEAKPKELQALKIDPARYESWRPSKKVKFRFIVESIDFVLNNLK